LERKRLEDKGSAARSGEEIPDAEHELLVTRVAAIDVAKASGKVCVRLPGHAGRRVSRVWDVAATSGAVTELAEQLVGQGIEKVTVDNVGLLADLVLPAGGGGAGRAAGQRPGCEERPRPGQDRQARRRVAG
jgi:hypothetical protein